MSTQTIRLAANDGEPLHYTDAGAPTGRPLLILHGGAGLETITDLADRLVAAQPGARVITPVHPGFGHTPRGANLTSPTGLGALYAGFLEALELEQVLIVASSMGGWAALELALSVPDRIAACVLLDGVGIVVPEGPPDDFFTLTPAEIAARNYHDPSAFHVDRAAQTEATRALKAVNRAAMAVYTQNTQGDPTLQARLAHLSTPTLVLWGASDRVVTPAYGRVLAAAIPNARFELIQAAGHLPQLEQPEAVTARIIAFATETSGPPARSRP